MIPFPGWRNVGLTMRALRQQEGVQGPAIKNHPFGRSYSWGWPKTGQVVTVTVTWGIAYSITSRGPLDFRLNNPTSQHALRVLAALELIPANIAYAAEERYGRCKRLTEWSPPAGDLWPGRWFHVHDRDEQFTGFADHLAEVAE